MTGAMSTTHAGKEGRDPSPSLKPASSGSSDEVEPWDEPPSKASRENTAMSNPLGEMMKSVNEFLGVGGSNTEEDGLEDGDLPTLSLKKKQRVSGQYVSGERTTRPLSPPSTNGVEQQQQQNVVKDNDPPMRRSRVPTPRTAKQIAAQRQFWSQLNPPSPFESDVSRDQSEMEAGDDGPDDEMAAVNAARMKTSRARELNNVPKQEDETVEGDESYRGNVAKVNSYEDGSGTCIEYTLASIGDICGTGQKSPIKDKNRPTKIREIHGAIDEEMVADDAEEHTAIEVEYVDPGPVARRSPPPPAAVPSKKEKKKQEKAKALSPKAGKELPTSRALDGESVELRESEATAWSSSRKNAVLAAMARKAKEDFQKHEEEVSNQGSTPVTPRKTETAAADQDNTSDVYNSFSPSEKRKFLKLINLGLTPTESTTRVVEERKGKDGAKTPGSGKKRFSFWKKSGKVDASPTSAAAAAAAASNDIQSVSSTAAVGEAEDVAPPTTPESPRASVDSEAAMDKAYSPRAKDSSAAAPSTTSREIPNEATLEKREKENGVGPADKTPESSSPDESEKSDTAAAVATASVAAAAAGVGVVAARQAAVTKDQDNMDAAPSTTQEEEDDDETSEEEDDSVRGAFPRSGVNYYDGVRRELPEEEDSDDDFGGSDAVSPSGKSSTKGRLASLTLTPKSQGFSSLPESERSVSLKKDGDAPKSISKSLSPLGRQSKSSSKDRTPLSPGSSTSARRRYLGIPILSTGKGFTPLEEDEDAIVTKAVQEELSPKRNDQSQPSTGVKSAVAVGSVATAAAATAIAVDKNEKSSPSDIAAGTSEDKPLASMDDPFYGLDNENADPAQHSKNQVTPSDDVIQQQQAKGQERAMDTSLDSYLDSATIQTYATSQQDQQSLVGGSVLSGRSGYTAATGMTNHTQSSRKRRPGAAKERIEKAKRAGKDGPAAKGWHESIRAAAESNNRKWDPQKGWVDYKDPNEDVKDTSEERLRISLDGVNMGSPRTKGESGKDEGSQSPSVPVPFPPGWEKERNDMISPTEAVSRQGSAPVTPTQTPPPTVTSSGQSRSLRVQPSDEQDGSAYPRSVVSDDSPKPRGWEDSMREASAGVSKDGRRWDAERGWVGLDKSVVESSPLSPRKDEQDATRNISDTASTSGKSDSSGKQVASPNDVFAALTKVPSEEKIQDAHDYAEAETRSITSRSSANKEPKGESINGKPTKEPKMDTFIEKSSRAPPTAATNRSEQSTEGSDQAVVAGVGEKYVQLGDNGAVKSVRSESRHKKSKSQDKLPFHPSSLRKASTSKSSRPDSLYDDDKAPLLTGSTDSTEERAPDVKVVKERVDEDDFSLFTADEGATVGTGSGHGTPSRRRGTGPVDVDEVDDLDTETESEDGDEEGHLWEPDSYMKGNVSPGMFVKPRSERSADPAFGAVTKGKTPPKLQKSRRDTSPIRSVGGNEMSSSSPQHEVISPRQVVSPTSSPRAPVASSSPDESPARQGGIEPTVSIGDDSTGSSNVKQLAQKWEVRARHGTPIVHDQMGDSFEYDERHVTALGDFGGDEQQQSDDWTGYPEKQSPSAGSTQEWKSFLGKKVQAESVAAASATMEDSRKREGGVASKAGIPRAPGKSRAVPGMSDRATQDENGDSSFSFGEGPSDGDDYSPAMSAGSAAARRRERASQQQHSSSPGGFSDVSPIQPREEYDVARMERVSDTGTAVEQSSFMKRLSACAAPLSRAFAQPNNACGDTPPNAHLAFMKTNPAGQPSPTGSGRYVPAALCGRQDVINESEESDAADDGSSKRSLDDTQDTENASPPTSPIQILREVKERSSSRGRGRRNDPVSDMRSTSSVASDDFGARTSYLEAIALRSAVSSTSSKKKKSRRKSAQDTQSTVSDATSESKLSHSERWQAFLERKASQTASPPGSRAQSSTDVSRAAEKYASEKVEEMMEVMASRSKSTPKSWRREEVSETLDTSYGGDSSTASPLSPYRLAGEREESRPASRKSKKKSESAKAAEELAAARVEAMMAAMTSSNLDEGEI